MNTEICNKNINLRRVIYTCILIFCSPLWVVLALVLGFVAFCYVSYLPAILAATIAFLGFKHYLGTVKSLGVAFVAYYMVLELTDFLLVHFC